MFAGRNFPSRAAPPAPAAATPLDRPHPASGPASASPLPRLPPGSAAVCARRGLRALPGPHEGGHPRAQVRPAASRRARAWARCWPQAIAQLAAEAPAEMLVVPVPLHRVKARRARLQPGARRWPCMRSQSLRKSHPEWRLTLASSTLMRLRATESQAGLTPAPAPPECARRLLRSPIRPRSTAKHILLIDDILTTGATARAAAQALIRAGAASVWVATLARARRVHEFTPSAQLKSKTRNGSRRSAQTCTDRKSRMQRHASIHSSQDQPSF